MVFGIYGYSSFYAWTPAVLSILYACVLYFCICTCSVHLSRNTLITIVIIIIIKSLDSWQMDVPPKQEMNTATLYQGSYKPFVKKIPWLFSALSRIRFYHSRPTFPLADHMDSMWEQKGRISSEVAWTAHFIFRVSEPWKAYCKIASLFRNFGC